jgi:hypothetical protein
MPFSVFAQNSSDLKIVEQNESFEKIKNSLEQLKVSAEKITTQKYYDCLKVVGNNQFCTCIRDNLPVSVDWDMYNFILTSDKQALRNNVNENDKNLIELTFKARNMCSKQIFGTK